MAEQPFWFVRPVKLLTIYKQKRGLYEIFKMVDLFADGF